MLTYTCTSLTIQSKAKSVSHSKRTNIKTCAFISSINTCCGLTMSDELAVSYGHS